MTGSFRPGLGIFSFGVCCGVVQVLSPEEPSQAAATAAPKNECIIIALSSLGFVATRVVRRSKRGQAQRIGLVGRQPTDPGTDVLDLKSKVDRRHSYAAERRSPTLPGLPA